MGIKLILHQKNIASKSLILKYGQKICDPYYPLAEDKNKDMELILRNSPVHIMASSLQKKFLYNVSKGLTLKCTSEYEIDKLCEKRNG